MKLTIERSALLKALAHVQSVVERRNTIPILANVMIDAQDTTLALTATDMDLTINEQVPADIQQPGKATAPAHTLYDIARKLPDGTQVDIETDADTNQLVVRAGRSRFALGSLPTEDFPVLSGGDLPIRFSMSVGNLRSLIDRTRFAISTEETRYYLNGIYLHVTGDEPPVMRAVATDGHRLARVEMALPDGAAKLAGVIIPRKAINEVRKLIDEGADSVEIGLSETRIQFSLDHITLMSKLIDGTFPDYERVIPTNNDKIMKVPCGLFASAVDRVATISTEKSRAVKLALGDSGLTLTANRPAAGSAREERAVEYRDDAIEIGFNARYLLDITQQVEGDDIEVALSDPASPTLVRDADDASALYVLMPMRV